MSEAAPQIVVVGSINMDLVIRCRQLPRPGETRIAESSQEVPGGKGANQAVAAARCGGLVAMVGRVGDDAFAERLLENLARERIDLSHVSRCQAEPSGLAVVAVDDQGENSILVVPGANARLTPEDVERAAELIANCNVLLLQLEIPRETVLAAMNIARQAGVRIVLDPAPAPSRLPPELLAADLVCPNLTEAEAILDRSLASEADACQAARDLATRGGGHAIITLGSGGAALSDGRSSELVAPFPSGSVDSTAAGDAFAGAIAVRWAEGAPLTEAVRFANAAGALAAGRLGAQIAMPTRDEIEVLCRANGL